MDALGIDFVRTILLLLSLLSIYFGVCESLQERSVRIVGDESPRKGRVEIFENGEWGTVSVDGWSDTEAGVVCQQLGFDGPAVAMELGQGEIAIAMDVPVFSVKCTDTDDSLTFCTVEKTAFSTFSSASFAYLTDMIYWDHKENAGVECKNEVKSNVAIIVINVFGVLAVIGIICTCGCLSYRIFNRKDIIKKRQAETNVVSEGDDLSDKEMIPKESVAMYSSHIEKDYSVIPGPEDRAQQYAAINPLEVEPENEYMTATC